MAFKACRWDGLACRNLALGIGIQNFPEGLAVSLPLHRAGYSKWQAFWYVFAVGAAISAVVAGRSPSRETAE